MMKYTKTFTRDNLIVSRDELLGLINLLNSWTYKDELIKELQDILDGSDETKKQLSINWITGYVEYIK